MKQEYVVHVNIIKTDKEKTEDEVDVSIDLNDFYECGEYEKINFIIEETKKQYEDVQEVCFDEEDLKDLQSEIDDMNDTSVLHPNESYEEFMEHENFDD